MRSYLTAAALAVLFAAPAGQALAAGPCADFELIGTGLTFDYDPFHGQAVNRAFALRVRRLDPTITSVQFLLMDNSPATSHPRVGPFGPLDYNIVWREDETRTVFGWGAMGLNPSNGARAGFGGPHDDTAVENFRISVLPGQEAKAGNNIEDLVVRYACFTGTTRLTEDRDQIDGRVPVELRVPRYVGAYVGGVNDQYGRIDFGDLTGGDNPTKSVSITAISTVPYNVRVSTDNGGQLQRGGRGPGIPYSMEFAALTVADGAKMRCPTTPAPSGSTQTLDVTLNGSGVNDLRAGRYTDTITLTFTPRDGAPPMSSCVAQGG